MCGKEKLHLYKAIVEGSLISVCEGCKEFGEVISVEKPKINKPVKEKKESKPNFVDEEKQEIIVDNSSEIIKEAREKKEITQENLAKSIAEKESVIQKVESNQMALSLNLAKKLEQFLRIKLIEQFNPDKKPIKGFNIKDEALTIGDMIRLRKK